MEAQMPYIVSVFNEQSNLDEALESLYNTGIEADDIVIMRDAGLEGDGVVDRNDTTDLVLPAVALYRPNTGGTARGGAAPFVLGAEHLDIDDEAYEYYQRIADDGAVVVFVEADDDEVATNVDSMLQKYHPTRLDRLDY
jgi:hypothetical protein